MTRGRDDTALRHRSADASSLLLTLAEARHRIDREHLRPVPARSVRSTEALGRVSSSEIRARRNEPAVDSAAMDGFAVRYPAGRLATRFRLLPGLVTLLSTRWTLGPGEAIRIVTGAPLPRRTDFVVRQERALVTGRELRVRRPIRCGTDVHPMAEDLQQGSRILRAGERIRPYHIGLLLAQAISRVRTRDPRVALVAVGDELAAADRPSRGRVTDSVSPLIAALLPPSTRTERHVVGDNASDLSRRLRELAKRSDLIITVGGSSVGAKDRTKSAVARVGRIVFGGVRVNVLKRGAFGRIGRVPVVILPGQVVSAVAAWHEFGTRVLARLTGEPPPALVRVRLRKMLRNPHAMDSLFLLEVADGGATPLRWGVRLYSQLLRANAIAVVPRHTSLPRGTVLRARPLAGAERSP